ncbi:MAG TPA: hypothetical protein VLR26_06745 [Frankiaceae bacterium]|nr:hypothetical protein [Frankiaceae bacterium]
MDLLEVSSGGNVPQQKITVGPGYQVPFARAVRETSGLPVGAVGLITEPVQPNIFWSTARPTPSSSPARRLALTGPGGQRSAFRHRVR